MSALVTLKIYFDQLYNLMEAIIWGLVFGRQLFSKKAQYLVNGESDHKSVTSKTDAELNSRPHPSH